MTSPARWLAAGYRQRRLLYSPDDMRLHFGLGAEKQADEIEVRWPDGTTTRVAGVKAGQVLRVEQPR